MESLINSIGGYNSWQFTLLLIFCFIVGSILVKTVSPYFTLLLIVGVTLLTGLIDFTVKLNPELPTWTSWLPLAFVATVLVGILWGLTTKTKKL